MVVALLLIIAGIESNPGPAAGRNRGDIVFGSINIHSAVNRSALVHTIIVDNKLDVLALQETWMDVDDPSAIQADVAPAAHGVLHVLRPRFGSDRGTAVNARPVRGGGLAVVYRHGLHVKVNRMQSTTPPTTFERQLITIKAENSTGIAIMNVYRPPSPSTSTATQLQRQHVQLVVDDDGVNQR